MATDPVVAAVQEVISTDDELRKYAKRLAVLAMREATDVLLHGIPSAKATMAAKFVPAIVKALETQQTDDEHAALRADFMKMVEQMGAVYHDDAS